MKLFIRLAIVFTFGIFLIAESIAKEAQKIVLPEPIVDADYLQDGSPSEKSVELGRLLFFDKILSGNQNIACATCHHPDHATSDGLSLPLGEGAIGLGPHRKLGDTVLTAVHDRVPRNSPALFNIGAREYTVFFHDGRVEADINNYYEAGFITPARWKLPKGLHSELAAQAMFPMTSSAEMAGQKGENAVADASSMNNAAGKGGVWETTVKKLMANAEYVRLFKEAYPDVVKKAEDIRIVLVANSLADFQASAFRSDNSAFDLYLRGDSKALSKSQKRGMDLFYGKANCASCHSGKFQTDHSFHAIAMPQIGPGKDDGTDASYWRETGMTGFFEDFGRGRVTDRAEDNYKFRTPSLRNVELTGPWGHAGSHTDLKEVVRHHLDPVNSLRAYVPPDDLLPELPLLAELAADGSTLSQKLLNENKRQRFLVRDTWVLKNKELNGRIIAANELEPIKLRERQVSDLVEFLKALTDPAMKNLGHLVPESVPSGLEVAD